MEMDASLLLAYFSPYLLVHSQSLLPDLDLPGPVAGGCSRRQNGMLGNAQAGLAVGAESVQHVSVVVIVEVGGASGAS